MDVDTILLLVGGAVLFFILMGIIDGVSKNAKNKAKMRTDLVNANNHHSYNLDYLTKSGFLMEERYHPNNSSIFLYFDYTNRHAALEYFDSKQICSELRFFPLDKIIDCELVQDGTAVSKESGTLYGSSWGYGGVISGRQDASTNTAVVILAIRLQIDDIRIPSLIINVLDKSINKTDPLYQSLFLTAQEIYGKFQGILHINIAQRERAAKRVADAQTKKSLQLPEDVLSQIQKLSELKDAGILTEQEFEAKKQLLMEKSSQ